MTKKQNSLILIPIMFTFFTMGFVDLVGIASNYVKVDFNLSDTVTNTLPSMVFLWFFLLSIPAGILTNRIGRKNTVMLSLIVMIPSLVLPLLNYTFVTMLLSFSLLGIGNTLMQVSLNPLIAGITSENRIASTLTLGQFIKALASFIAPVLAGWAALYFKDWRLLMFPIFALLSVLSLVCLFFTKMNEDTSSQHVASLKNSFSLLKNSSFLYLFLGIMTTVGLDVGINTTAPRLLMEKFSVVLSDAGYITSFYFIFRTIGCLVGAIILARYNSKYVFITSLILIIVGILSLFSSNLTLIYIGIALFGLGNSNIFSIIFSHSLIMLPKKQNEVSAIMVMGISGGAVIPLLMGFVSDSLGGQVGAVLVLLILAVYLFGSVMPQLRKMREI